MGVIVVSLLEYLLDYVSSLAVRVERRIERFAKTCNREILVYWSGGKDSTLAILAARQALGYKPPAAIALVPGQSNMTQVARLAKMLGYQLKFCRERVCRPEPGVVSGVARREDFWSLLERYGLPVNVPGRAKRWCCAKFKSEQLERLPGGCAVAGYKAGDSAWRKRLYAGLDPELPVIRAGGRSVLAPLFDLDDQQVWALLSFYDPRVYELLREWYEAHPSSPDCQLCLVVGAKRFERAARSAPAPLLRRALAALETVGQRHKPGSQSRRRAMRYIEVLRSELERRGAEQGLSSREGG